MLVFFFTSKIRHQYKQNRQTIIKKTKQILGGIIFKTCKSHLLVPSLRDSIMLKNLIYNSSSILKSTCHNKMIFKSSRIGKLNWKYDKRKIKQKIDYFIKQIMLNRFLLFILLNCYLYGFYRVLFKFVVFSPSFRLNFLFIKNHCGGISISLRCESKCQFHNIQHNLYKQCRWKKSDKNKNVKKQTIFYFITTEQIKKYKGSNVHKFCSVSVCACKNKNILNPKCGGTLKTLFPKFHIWSHLRQIITCSTDLHYLFCWAHNLLKLSCLKDM